jgi:peptide-methionine (S)-S-oxide reductase
VIRTRVGYSGGKTPHPTYRSMGDHSECIQIDFDPAQVSYEQLLALALQQGNFVGTNWSRQYRSAVFYHNKHQLQVARKLGIKQLEPAGAFTRAEDYHQKYYLQQSDVAKDFYARYPDARTFTDSTAVTRANGIVGGHIDAERLKNIVPQLGVSEKAAQAMYRMAGSSKSGCAVP